MPTWYHGGPSGLSGMLFPADDTGAETLKSWAPTDKPWIRTDRVYVTSYRPWAEYCAAWREGSVYVVTPIGLLEPDPDYIGPDPDCARMCLAARVVHERPLSAERIRRIRATTITRPSMGWDGHTDPETFARENTTYLNARSALATCIRMATEALYAPY